MRDDLHGMATSWTNDWKLAGGVDLKSITAYRYTDAVFGRDGDNSYVNYNGDIHDEHDNTFTQELQASGKWSQLKWVAGAYYLNERTRDQTNLVTAQGLFDALTALGPANPLYVYRYALDFNLAYDNRQTTKDYAGYLNLDWAFNERLSLQAGVRYTDETKDFSQSVMNDSGQDHLPARQSVHRRDRHQQYLGTEPGLQQPAGRGHLLHLQDQLQGVVPAGEPELPVDRQRVRIPAVEPRLPQRRHQRPPDHGRADPGLQARAPGQLGAGREEHVLRPPRCAGTTRCSTTSTRTSRCCSPRARRSSCRTLPRRPSTAWSRTCRRRHPAVERAGRAWATRTTSTTTGTTALGDYTWRKLQNAPEWTANISSAYEQHVASGAGLRFTVNVGFQSWQFLDGANSPVLRAPSRTLVDAGLFYLPPSGTLGPRRRGQEPDAITACSTPATTAWRSSATRKAPTTRRAATG